MKNFMPSIFSCFLLFLLFFVVDVGIVRGQNEHFVVPIANETSFPSYDQGSNVFNIFEPFSLRYSQQNNVRPFIVQYIIPASHLTHLIGKELNALSFRLPHYSYHANDPNQVNTTSMPLADLRIDSLSITLGQGVAISNIAWVPPANANSTSTANYAVFANNISSPVIVRKLAPLTFKAESFQPGITNYGQIIHFDTVYVYTGGNLVVEMRSLRAYVQSSSPNNANMYNPAAISLAQGFWTLPSSFPLWSNKTPWNNANANNLICFQSNGTVLGTSFSSFVDSLPSMGFMSQQSSTNVMGSAYNIMFRFSSCTDTAVFASIAPICVGTDIELPSTSLNGYEGTWDAPLNNQQTTTYTFTPNSGQCVKGTSQLTVAVYDKPAAQFDQITPICEGSFFTLPSVSNDGIIGSWSPAPNYFQTTTYTFTPVEGQCGAATSMSVAVNTQEMPTFLPVDAICAGDNLVLPSVSTNNIAGTWYPAPNNQETTTYTFVPNVSECTVPLLPTMTVVVNMFDSLTFDVPSAICLGADVGSLPSSSLEGVLGTWQPATINENETTIYTFSPDAGQCASDAQLVIVVQPNTMNTPVGESVQEFLLGQRISALQVSGTNLIWYSDSLFSLVLGENEALVDGETYYVVSDNGVCRSDYLAITVVRKGPGSALSIDTQEWENFTYYPNPVADMLTLSSDRAIDAVKVSNMLGQTLDVPLGFNNSSVDFSSMPPSLYLVTVTIQGLERTFKVTKHQDGF